jgi:predicted amidophosphoribosyltransferase
MEQAFSGRIPVQGATSLFYYSSKGSVRQLIYDLKYRGKQEIGSWAGHHLGHLMLRSERFNDLSHITGVPLLKSRLRSRGYNQVNEFGRALGQVLELPYSEGVLERIGQQTSQTTKARAERWENVIDQFRIKQLPPANSHVLLIDDVVTTGATMESCYLALRAIPGLKMSLASIAFTK